MELGDGTDDGFRFSFGIEEGLGLPDVAGIEFGAPEDDRLNSRVAFSPFQKVCCPFGLTFRCHGESGEFVVQELEHADVIRTAITLFFSLGCLRGVGFWPSKTPCSLQRLPEFWADLDFNFLTSPSPAAREINTQYKLTEEGIFMFEPDFQYICAGKSGPSRAMLQRMGNCEEWFQ